MITQNQCPICTKKSENIEEGDKFIKYKCNSCSTEWTVPKKLVHDGN